MFYNGASTGSVDVRTLTFPVPPSEEQVRDLIPDLGSSTDRDYTILSDERPSAGVIRIVARAANEGTLVSILRRQDGTVITTRQPASQESITNKTPAQTVKYLDTLL
jgi:hypothetical protein